MVVDSRYQKVAKEKYRFYALIFIQAVIHSIGAVYALLTTLKALFQLSSFIIGELGQRHSRVSFLKVYIVASTAATLLWIAYVDKSNFTLEHHIVFLPPTPLSVFWVRYEKEIPNGVDSN